MQTTLVQRLDRIEEQLATVLRLLNERADELLDIDGASMLIGRSRSAIYQLTCTHGGEPPELPHYRTGKRLYFKRSELIAWMTQHKVKTRGQVEAEARDYIDRNLTS